MLDSHPDLAIPPETHFISTLLRKNFEIKSFDEFIEILTKSGFWDDFGLDINSFRNNLSKIKNFNISDGLRCFFNSYASRFGKNRWGDKTPHYLSKMQEINTILPEVRFIHVIRDGRDVALSYKGLWFGPEDDTAKQANFWKEKIKNAREQALKLPFYMEVRYEDLVGSPHNFLTKICSFISIQFSHKMETYYLSANERLMELMDRKNLNGDVIVKKDKRRSIFSLVSQKPDVSRIARWKKEMPIEEQKSFESIAGNLLRELGYETRFKESTIEK